MLFFHGYSKDCESSSTVTFLSKNFLVCDLYTGLVWMKSSVESFTAVFVLEHVSAVSDYLIVIYMFWLNFSLLLEVDEVMLEGSLVLSFRFLFVLPSLCAWPILLAMVDE